ncbi:MAG TPA: tetratricopeptide repeat protein [Acidimicrobiales bacterium]|nr:tetratricopeptide repeat protein [Acidimicrobiales bacterium]
MARRGAREVTRKRDDADEDRPERKEPTRGAPTNRRQVAWTRDDGRDEWADTPPKKRRAGTAAAPPKTRTPTPKPARPRARTRQPTQATQPPTGPSTTRALAALTNRTTLPPEVATEIRNAADVATSAHKERLVEQAEAAFTAYERGRSQDALRHIKQVVAETPSVAAVQELTGLAAYRSGRWREAARHLQTFGDMTDSTTHLPELMDCQRALRKPKKVAELWTELRQSSPDPDVLAEGRIVAAASLAETGDLNGAISMLATAGASKNLRNPAERHLRQWYVLGDLYERAGDIPRAREYFERVRRSVPDAYDVAERLRSLGPERRAGGPRRPARKTAH